jgi:NAD(P)-dependent dehydrogenase (short-subunit alcohol dehydrogenase family)
MTAGDSGRRRRGSPPRPPQVASDRAIEEFGRLDGLVNCAGTTKFIDFRDLSQLTDHIWSTIFWVKVLGAFYASRVAPPWLKESWGAIVNVAPVSGTGPPGLP